MKSRKSNHHAVQIYAPDVYCLIENCVGGFVDAFASTSVLSPPPPPPLPTSPLNITTHNGKNTLIVSSGSVNATMPARPFWNVVGFWGYPLPANATLTKNADGTVWTLTLPGITDLDKTQWGTLKAQDKKGSM